MSKASKSYDKATEKIARWLDRSDWAFESYSGSFAPGSAGQTPIPLTPDALAPYLENFSTKDNIVSYELNSSGRELFDIDFMSLGSGQLKLVVSSAIPGLEAPYNIENSIGTVSIKPNKSGSFKNPRQFTVSVQSLPDGDGTVGNWVAYGNLDTRELSVFGLERGADGLTNNVGALIACVVQ